MVRLWSLPSTAVVETYDFESEVLRERYHQFTAELRCPKCQNQNIADSNAPIAKDLRNLLHQQLEAGASDDDIRAFMVARYGEFVLYRPRYSGVTLLLWLAPVLLLLTAGCAVFLLLRRREEGTSEGGTINEADQQRLAQLLGDSEEES